MKRGFSFILALVILALTIIPAFADGAQAEKVTPAIVMSGYMMPGLFADEENTEAVWGAAKLIPKLLPPVGIAIAMAR